MRTIHVDFGREMRGGQYQALSLVESLQDAALLAREESPLFAEARRRGLRVLPARRFSLRGFDLAHAHDAKAHTWLALHAACPFVVSRRVAFPVKRGWLSRWKYAKAAHYLAVSRFVASQLVGAGVPDDNISVVYDGVDVPPGVSRGGCILAVRSEDPGKGTALIERSGVEVTWASSLVEDLQTASVFLYITESEGLGSAALLAMAAGVPVVASNVGGLPEAVRHGETGILTPNEPAAIAEAVREALAGRGTMAPLARRHVEENFTRGAMVERTLAVYRKVLG